MRIPCVIAPSYATDVSTPLAYIGVLSRVNQKKNSHQTC